MRRMMLPAYGAGPYLPAIVLERPVYVREMSDGLYSPLTYIVYKVCFPQSNTFLHTAAGSCAAVLLSVFLFSVPLERLPNRKELM